jgi:hypothetical protein
LEGRFADPAMKAADERTRRMMKINQQITLFKERMAALEAVAIEARRLVELDGDDPRRHAARVDLFKALAALEVAGD